MLIAILDSRQTIQVGDQNLAISVPPALDIEDEVVIDMMTTEALSPPPAAKALRTEIDVVAAASESNSNRNTSSWEAYGYFFYIYKQLLICQQRTYFFSQPGLYTHALHANYRP
jgi:hypothetical protein